MKWGFWGLVLLLIVVTACGKALEPEKKPLPVIDFYFSVVDMFDNSKVIENTGFFLNGTLLNVKDENGGLIKYVQSGDTKSKNTLLKIPQDSVMSFYSCVNNEDYYQKQHIQGIGNAEQWITTDCIRKVIPESFFEPKCLITDLTMDYKLNLTTKKGGVMHMSICEKHTSGIDSVFFTPKQAECSSGWSNCGVYDYDYKVCRKELPLGDYRCETKIEKCSQVLGIDKRLCIKDTMSIPERLKNKVNSCHNLNENLIDESIEIPLIIQTNKFLSDKDIVSIVLIDKEYTSDRIVENKDFEEGGKDLGAEDILIKIKRCGN